MIYIDFFPLPFLFALVLLLVLLAINWRKSGWQKAALVGLWVYLVLVALVIFFPIRVPEDWPANVSLVTVERYLRYGINVIPFRFGMQQVQDLSGLMERPFPFYDVWRNILLTMPFGAGIRMLSKPNLGQMLLIALAAGLVLEGTQFLLSLALGTFAHVTDINDVIMNAAGVLAGGLLQVIFSLLWGVVNGPTARAR